MSTIWKIAIIFAVFLLIDILGHICFKIKRKIGDYLMLAIVSISLCTSIIWGITRGSESDLADKKDLYISYKYLLDGNIRQAKLKLVGAGGSQKVKADIIGAIADLADKNYVSSYFTAKRLKEEELSASDKKYVDRIIAISGEELGITDGKDSSAKKSYDSYDEYLKDLSAESKEDAKSEVNGNQEKTIDSSVKKLADGYMHTLDISGSEASSYNQDYELDSKLTATSIDRITIEDINELKEKYGNTEDVRKLELKYYVSKKDYEKAVKKAKGLVNKYNSEENQVILTDIIAQESFEKNQRALSDGKYTKDMFDMTDDEVNELIEKAKSNKDKASDYYNDAANIKIKRAINYILSKEPADGDNTGLYDLQLAKLYLITGDRETAGNYLHKVIDNSVDVSDDSSIREALDNVVSEYNQITGDEYNASLNSQVNELVRQQSSGVVEIADDTVNGSFRSYVTNTLKYDKINVHISRIETDKYPEITAYVNINGEKDGKEDLASDFEKEDFSLIDTQYEITNFKLSKDNSKVSVAIVMDHSGSMDGAPLDNAKIAAKEAIKYMDTGNERMAIVSYDDSATVEQGLTDKQKSLNSAIEGITNGGGTNISLGLTKGIEEVDGERGSKAVILMSDGQDNGTREDMEKAIEKAYNSKVPVYTVAFGECDEEYMKWIADETGGKYIKADDSSDLADIYLALQKYIVNNYKIEYKVTKNKETDPRFLTVNIDKYNTSDTLDYYLKEPEEKEEGEEENQTDIEKMDENTLDISSVSPNGASKGDIKNGIEISITGSGFDDTTNIVINTTPLKDVQVISKTELKGTLKGDFEPGQYSVKAKLDDGRMATKNDIFFVSKAGTSKSVKVGCVTITAGTIGQINDNTLVASGNVMINNFIHSSGDMKIEVDNMDKNIDLTKGTTVYAGNSGKLSGQSKLYVSYEQMTKKNGNFASLVMGGKDYVIHRNSYVGTVDQEKTTFDENTGNYNLKIPFIMNIDAAEVNLYSNRLQVDLKSVNLKEIISNMSKSLRHKTGNNKEEPKVQSRSSANKFSIGSSDAGISMAITPDGMEFGGEAKLGFNDSIVFDNFGLNELSLKLNSLDADKEYWKIGCKIDLGRSLPAFKDGRSAGFEGSIGSYYWLPDSIDIKDELDPGITVYKIVEINELEGEFKGLSTIALKLYEKAIPKETYEIIGSGINSKEYKYQDIVLTAKAKAEANVFASIDGNHPVLKKFKQWGEIGTINGSAGINFSNPGMDIKADMELLGSEKAEAEAKIDKDGLDITGDVNLALSGFGLELSGGGKAEIKGDVTGASIYTGINGKLVCPVLSISYNGESGTKLEFQWNLDKIAVTVNYKDGAVDKEASLWYEDDGSLLLFNKIHASVN